MEDLKCRSYRMQTGQLLTEANKARRVLKCNRLLNKLKHPKKPGMIWFFSDEKNFTQDQVFNKQNNRWIAMNNSDVPKVMKTKFAATVMVFGVISSEGDVMPPHIFEKGLRVNWKIYLDVMEKVVVPWCNKVANGRPWMWQQDSAPAHRCNKTQEWLADPANGVFDFVPFSHWPPSSPDCNPCDYFLWSYLETMTNRTSHNTKGSLIAAIEGAFRDIPRAHVQKACARFRSRLERVLAAEGGYFE
jgi:inhibitor of nuclear factor kappa-B kinase subunit alpha